MTSYTHHLPVSTRGVRGRIQQHFSRCLAIMNLPPDEEDVFYNGTSIADLSWECPSQEKEREDNGQLLRRFSYDKGINTNPHNVDESGRVFPGKYKGKQPYMWRAQKWVSLVDPRIQCKVIRLQQKLAVHDLIHREQGRLVAFFIDEANQEYSDVLHVDFSAVPSVTIPFSDLESPSTLEVMRRRIGTKSLAVVKDGGPKPTLPRRKKWPVFLVAAVLAATLLITGYRHEETPVEEVNFHNVTNPRFDH